MKSQSFKTEAMAGEAGYVNKNCWLARNLGYPPSGRCRYCELKFRNCLFEHYLLITLALVGLILVVSYLIEQKISKSLIVSLFVLVIAYGYFFNKSTEKLIISNFKEGRAKNALKDLSENLQKEVDEQTKEIRDQKDEIEKAYKIEKQAHQDLLKLDEAKTNFMLVTQHHLRTPLSITMGFLDLLLSGHFGKVPKKMVDTLQKSSESIQKEISVVNDLLNVSSFQLGHGYVQLEPCIPIKKMIEEIVNDLKPVADNRKLYLRFESENNIPEIIADQKQIKMAMQNIIDNAMKYTKEGGVTVKIKAEDNKIKIIVTDTGIGMNEEDKKYLFDKPFQRSKEAWSQNATGKGIGVYLSAQIIKAHGGKIEADSEGRGKGSAFNIELPIDATTFANKQPALAIIQ